MSVRSYRIKKIDHEESESFNLSHDEELREFLIGYGCTETLNEDSCGIMDVSVDVLEEALSTLNLDKDVAESIRKDIEAVKANGDDIVSYYCF